MFCWCQQTLPYVIINIASPPTGALSLFNLYVVLSRSSGRASIRLLHNFDDKLFMASHNPALVDEDERLESLKHWNKIVVQMDGWNWCNQSCYSYIYKSQIDIIYIFLQINSWHDRWAVELRRHWIWCSEDHMFALPLLFGRCRLLEMWTIWGS